MVRAGAAENCKFGEFKIDVAFRNGFNKSAGLVGLCNIISILGSPR